MFSNPYVVITLAAVLAPVLGTLFQVYCSYKLSKMQMAYEHKAPVYKNFTELYGMFYKHTTNETRQSFVSAAWSAALVSNTKCRDQILHFLKIFEDANDTTSQSIDEQFMKCVELLNVDLQKTYKFFKAR